MFSRRSGMAVFAVALLASLAVHLPVYEVLGVLRDRLFAEDNARRAAAPIEFELTSTDEPEPQPETAAPQDAPVEPPLDVANTPPVNATRTRLKVKAQQQPEIARETPKPEPKPVPPPEQPAPAEPTPPTPPPEMANQQAIIQRSADPTVAPPPDAKYLAEQNQRVEEETAATITNLQEDSPETHTAATRANDTPETGDSEEQEVADTREVEGDDSRAATPEEARRPVTQPSQQSAGDRTSESQPESVAAASQAPREAREAHEAGNPTAGGEPETLVINDGFGTVRVPNPRRVGQGAGEAGGQHVHGDHAHAQGAQSGVVGRNGQANLRVSWSQFENVFGSDQLQEQREAYAAQRRSKTMGGNSEREWSRFRSAIENFLPSVRPGNQTALNAAASPFAAYLVEVHNRIHREYAFRFIRSLSLTSGPFADPSLYTELEIVFNRNGTVHRIGVVRPSGFLPFDFGAYKAVMRAQPFPEPPASILSGDGRVYVHWGFYRNERQCGTFNASPFILPNPPGTPAPAQDPLHDLTPPQPPPSTPTEVPPDGTYGFNTHR